MKIGTDLKCIFEETVPKLSVIAFTAIKLPFLSVHVQKQSPSYFLITIVSIQIKFMLIVSDLLICLDHMYFLLILPETNCMELY